MKKHLKEIVTKNALISGFVIISLLFASAYLLHRNNSQSNKILELENKLSEIKNELSKRNIDVANLLEDNNELISSLDQEKEKVDSIQGKVTELTNSVVTLEKLTNTDTELLQKYSRVYFLNEHYIPEDLVSIDKDLLYRKKDSATIHRQVASNLKRMIQDAKEVDISLEVVSAYRSFDEQTTLKSNYLFSYGEGANQFSADQGYSEHQLGTTVDLTSLEENNPLTTGFARTVAYEWLTNNAYKYGFVLSYPENNSYYQFEPWHWRFVGIDLASHLDDLGSHFYDLDQREIDEYLVTIFD